MTTAKRPKPCASCGRSDWIEATDNHGEKYIGCANCRLLSLDELNAILVKGGYEPYSPGGPTPKRSNEHT